VTDLPKSDKIKFLTDPDQPVAHIISIKEEEAPTAEAVAGEAATAPAEPEVMKKGKQETEGEGAEAAPEKSEKKEKK
jgi:large subunit ribosomal protein L25